VGIRSSITYPNPFRPSGIEFELEHEGVISLELLGESGEVLEIVIREEQFSKGSHSVESSKFTISSIRYYRLTVVSEGGPITETKPIPHSGKAKPDAS